MPVEKRKSVAHLTEQQQVSQRRARDVLQVDRSSMWYLSRRGDDIELRDAIKRVAKDDCFGQLHLVHQHGDPRIGSGYGYRWHHIAPSKPQQNGFF